MYKEECVYNPEQDGRRSTPKAYVASLEERIRVLEGMLHTAGVDEEGTAKPAVTVSSADKMEETPVVDSGEDRLKVRLTVEWRGCVLITKIDEATGELHEVGPTSLFKHQGDGDVRSPASSLSPGSLGLGSASDRPALLKPHRCTLPQLGTPELDDVTHQEVLRLFFDYFNP